jgi:predicted signal transduction protein with EAL and GGDEF domain
MFGYSVIEMAGKDIFNEFYNIWLLNLAITLENLLKNDRIRKLIEKLRNLSIRDGLTGLLNRRGFDDFSRNAIAAMCGTKTICTVVIDLDGLKHIKATPHKARLTAWRRICLHLFRHLAQKFLAGRQPSGVISIQSDEKSDCASAPPALCGIALTMNSVIMKVTARSRLSRISLCAAAIPMK